MSNSKRKNPNTKSKNPHFKHLCRTTQSNQKAPLIVTSAALALALCGCTSTGPTLVAPNSKPLTVFFQSNRLGEIEPCGCHSKPYGGIDREYNALEKVRGSGRPTVYLDAGRSLAPQSFPPKSLTHYREKADWIAQTLSFEGLDVLVPSEAELKLGADWVEKERASVKFKWVSANLLDANGKPVFEPWVVLQKGDLRIGVIGISSPEAAQSIKGWKLVPTEKAITENLEALQGKADLIVLVSQLTAQESEKLAEKFPALHVIVSADLLNSLDDPLWVDGHTLIADPAMNGYLLGQLDVDFVEPFKGFSSPQKVQANQATLAGIRKSIESATDAGEKANLTAYAKRFEAQENLKDIPGASTYSHRLVRLSQEDFGKPNAVTERIQKFRAQVREKALKE